MPEPVPPPREWVSWNPCRQSQDSDSFLTTSRTESTNSAPKYCKNVVLVGGKTAANCCLFDRYEFCNVNHQQATSEACRRRADRHSTDQFRL